MKVEVEREEIDRRRICWFIGINGKKVGTIFGEVVDGFPLYIWIGAGEEKRYPNFDLAFHGALETCEKKVRREAGYED